MQNQINSLNQPIGFPLPDWKPPPRPGGEPMDGRTCRLEILNAESHATALFEANSLDTEGRNWTYLPYGPMATLEEYRDWIDEWCCGNDPLFYAVIDKLSNRAVGVTSYLRINPHSGSIEVGHINYSPLLQRKTAATEAMYLMMKRAFEMGYRRYEWKCDALNAASCVAAVRLGFTKEGVFRQATIYKGRNRDTAWYAIIDSEWPVIKEAYECWLDPSNFDGDGKQKQRLSELIITQQT